MITQSWSYCSFIREQAKNYFIKLLSLINYVKLNIDGDL